MVRRLTLAALCLWALVGVCCPAYLLLPRDLRAVPVLVFCIGVFYVCASLVLGGGSPSGPSPVRDGRVSPDPTVAPSQAVADTRSPLPGVGEDGARTVPPTGR